MVFKIRPARQNVWAACVMLVLLGGGVADTTAAEEDCQLKRVASLDITDAEGGLVLVLVGVNGKQRLFLVDTGGVYSTLAESVVKDLRLKTARIAGEVYDSYGHKLDRGAVVDSLMIGNNEAKYIHVLVDPDFTNSQIAGTLAPDLLSLFDVDFDFAKKKLNLFSPDHCEGKVVYWSKEYTDAPFTLPDRYHIQFQTSLDGHALTTNLDSGASVTAMHEPTALAIYRVSDTDPKAEKLDGKSFARYRYRFDLLSLNGIAVHHPLIYVFPDAPSQAFRHEHTSKGDNDPIYGHSLNQPQLILGADVLRQLHLYIAYKEHKIYVTAADAHL